MMICISSSSLARMARRRSIGLEHLGQLVDDLLALQAGEPLELHVEDGLRLNLTEA